MMMSVVLRDLHRCYPNQYVTGVETTAKEVWENNPYIANLARKTTNVIKLGYPLIHRSNQCGLHFIQGFIDDLNKKLNLKVRLTEFRPDLHWSPQELNEPLIEGDYWVVVSGGKADFTTKWWDAARYQEVIQRLEGVVNFVQIGGKPSGGGARHYHPPLNGALSMVGKTSLREAFRLCLHARGVLTPVTCFMHLAAAIGKPTVVIAGGREHYTWEAYNVETLQRNMAFASGRIKKPPGTPKQWEAWHPDQDARFVDHPFMPHKFLHTVGALKCCKNHGCWRTRVTEGKPEQNCSNVVYTPARVPLPRCLDMITVDRVVESILEYEKHACGENQMPSIRDLIVKVPNAGTPAPVQDPHPVIAKTKAKQARPSKRPSEPTVPLRPDEVKFKHLTFPITVCGLTYGKHSDLALRCLNSLYAHFDVNLFKLRYALNEPTKDARKQVLAFLEDKPNVERIYEAAPQVFKYPMMRRMFHDSEAPLTTDWVMWFDDDSHVVDRNWLLHLGSKVDEMFLQQDARYPRGYHMFGKVYYWHLRGNQWDWLKQAGWYAGRPLHQDKTKRPPMDKSDFCTGGFWLVTRDAIQAANWPDPRIKHRGGDIWMGVALQQQGYGVAQAYQGVKISDANLRGYNENIAGVE
jgi:hypothetical protein